MFRGMVTDLLRHGRVTTTVAKAKEVRSLAERMVTHGKKGSVHDRRMAAKFITDVKVVDLVFDMLADRYRDRNGGYTRIIRLGARKGDAAEMAVLELVEE